MTESSDQSVKITRRIAATPEEIFDAWTDADGMRTWMCAGDHIEARAQLDVRVGGKFKIDMVGPKAIYEHTGEYLVIDRPTKLSFTWISKPTNYLPTVVTIELKPVSATETELTLTHVGFPSADAANQHRGGWGSILEKLVTEMSSS